MMTAGLLLMFVPLNAVQALGAAIFIWGYARARKAANMFDLIAHLHRARDFSFKTFGPPSRGIGGVLDHIRKELVEIESAPHDVEEWIDLAILTMDGAMRSGHSPETIAAAWVAKQTKNEGRNWPDWRTAEPGKAIEHVRTADEQHRKDFLNAK